METPQCHLKGKRIISKSRKQKTDTKSLLLYFLRWSRKYGMGPPFFMQRASSVIQEVWLFPCNSSGMCPCLILTCASTRLLWSRNESFSKEKQLHDCCSATESRKQLRSEFFFFFFFLTVRKGVWENTSKKSHRWRVKNKSTFLSERTCASPHTRMQKERGSVLFEICPTQQWRGGGLHPPTCKTLLAKFTKCLEFSSVSHPLPASTNRERPGISVRVTQKASSTVQSTKFTIAVSLV